jgi:hypothetical protein
VDLTALRASAAAVVAGVATWVDSRIERSRHTRGSVPDAVSVTVDGSESVSQSV